MLICPWNNPHVHKFHSTILSSSSTGYFAVKPSFYANFIVRSVSLNNSGEGKAQLPESWRTWHIVRFVIFTLRMFRYEENYLLWCDSVKSGRIPPMFKKDVLLPSSRSKSKRRKKPARNRLCFPPFSLVAYSFALKMETICSSETSVDFYRTIRRYIPEDYSPHSHRCENLTSNTMFRHAFNLSPLR
jgi:hypothetical protein